MANQQETLNCIMVFIIIFLIVLLFNFSIFNYKEPFDTPFGSTTQNLQPYFYTFDFYKKTNPKTQRVIIDPTDYQYYDWSFYRDYQRDYNDISGLSV